MNTNCKCNTNKYYKSLKLYTIKFDFRAYYVTIIDIVQTSTMPDYWTIYCIFNAIEREK